MAATELDFVVRGLADPKASQGLFDLPCGYIDSEGTLHREVHITEMTGYEEDLLAAKNVPFHKRLNGIIAGCLKRIGTFTDPGQVAMIVQDLPLGDRTFLVFAIRQVSLGDAFPFTGKCPECETEQMFTVKLSDLDIKRMPEPTKRVYDDTLPSGKMVRFKVLTGKHEEEIAKASRSGSGDQLSISMQVRVELLDGKPASLLDLKKLGVKDRHYLRDRFEEVDGGVDTSMEMECPACGAEFEHSLDVGQVSFFFPSAMKKVSKKRSSS